MSRRRRLVRWLVLSVAAVVFLLASIWVTWRRAHSVPEFLLLLVVSVSLSALLLMTALAWCRVPVAGLRAIWTWWQQRRGRP